MKKIINKYHKRLTFPKLDISIEPDEIKKVLDKDYEILIKNSLIQEVNFENKIEKESIIKKGRNNIIKKINK